MEQKTERLHTSAPLEKIDIKQRIEKKLNYVNIFDNSINNTEGMITYFKDKNHISKRDIKFMKLKRQN